MADYIIRETAITHIKEKQCKGCSDIGLCGNCAVLIALKLLKNVPAADVVKVVRCKDCINRNGNVCITMHGLSAPRPDDYCSRGEREPDKNDQSKEVG